MYNPSIILNHSVSIDLYKRFNIIHSKEGINLDQNHTLFIVKAIYISGEKNRV